MVFLFSCLMLPTGASESRPADALCCTCAVVTDSLRHQGLKPARLLRQWDFPGKDTGVDSHSLHHGIFLTQGSMPAAYEGWDSH